MICFECGQLKCTWKFGLSERYLNCYQNWYLSKRFSGELKQTAVTAERKFGPLVYFWKYTSCSLIPTYWTAPRLFSLSNGIKNSFKETKTRHNIKMGACNTDMNFRNHWVIRMPLARALKRVFHRRFSHCAKVQMKCLGEAVWRLGHMNDAAENGLQYAPGIQFSVIPQAW
jgi:hypothetical protein